MAYVTSEELQLELEQLADDLGVSVQELLTSYYTKGQIDTTISGIVGRLDAIDVIDAADGVESLAEKISAINTLLTDPNNQTLATDILNRIADNATAITAEVNRATAAEAALGARVDTTDANVGTNAAAITALQNADVAEKAAQDVINADIEGRVSADETALTTLNGDVTVAGSVAKAVEDEKVRAQAELATEKTALQGEIVAGDAATLTSAKDYTDARETVIRADLAAGTASTQAEVDALEGAVSTLQSEMDATQAGLGLNADGSFTPVDGSDTLEEYVADVAGDANTLKKAIRKVARKSKAADNALYAKIDAEFANRTSEDASLQSQIDSLGGSGSGSLGDVETRLDAVEADLNDKTVNGEIVKGIKSKVTDLENGLVANQADQDAKDLATNARIDALSGSGLATGVICGRKAGNKFRAVFGLTPLDESGCGGAGGSTGGSGL